jgi:hypothetical protein
MVAAAKGDYNGVLLGGEKGRLGEYAGNLCFRGRRITDFET